MSKKVKGDYGYINNRKIVQSIYTFLSFAAAISIFIISYFLSGHTRNNIGTVLAIVMTLPACKCLVGLILIFPHKTMNKSIYDEVSSNPTPAIMLYDLLMTSNEKPMYVSAAAVGDDKVVMLVTETRQDKEYIKEYFNKVMNSYQHNANVVVCDNVKKFINIRKGISSAGENSEEIKKTLLTFGV